MPILNITFWLLIGFVIGWFAHAWQADTAISRLAQGGDLSAIQRAKSMLSASGSAANTDAASADTEMFRKQLLHGEIDNAIKTYSGLIDSHPVTAEKMELRLIEQAQRLTRQRRRQKARELINKLLEADAYSPRAILALAKLEALSQRHERALQYALDAKIYSDDASLTDAIDTFIKETTEKHEKILRQNKQWEKLAGLFYALLENADESEAMQYRYKIGEAQFRQGSLLDAIATLRQTLGDSIIGPQAQNLTRLLEQLVELGDSALAIPITNNNNQFLVETGINHVGDATLLIDTGATISILNSSFIETLGLDENGEPERGEMTIHTASDVKTIETITLDTLEIGGIEFEGMTVGITELPGQHAFDGILGMDVLSYFEFRIDQTNEILQLEF